MAKCDAFLLLDRKQITWIKRATLEKYIHMHTLTLSFHRTILLIKRKTPFLENALFGKHTFESNTINHKKGKTSLTTHFRDTKKRFTQHALACSTFDTKKKKTFIRDQILPK
jgi:hypothetical protein